MRLQAVLFDLDGTLLDTLADIADAMNAALRSLGLPEQEAECFKTFVGDGVDVLIRRVVPEERLDDPLRRDLSQRFLALYREGWDWKTRPYPGVLELLAALRARDVPMAVLSNKPDELTRRCVARFFPETNFFAVQGARPEIPKKPDPAAASRIAAELGREPAEFAYLGDTGTDMATAVAAGMFPIGALWGFRSAAELRAHGAHVLLGRPEELLPLFGDHA